VCSSDLVLIIVGDDHTCDGLGAYGSKLAHTPSLDRLAAQGVRFDRAYCNTPICSPSRQSFLCGRYPQTVGVTLLSHALDDSAYTLAHRLREAGYRTGAFGKMHFNSNRSHGFEVFKPESAYHAWDRSHPHRPLPEGLQILPPVFRPFQDPARVWLNGKAINTFGVPANRTKLPLVQGWNRLLMRVTARTTSTRQMGWHFNAVFLGTDPADYEGKNIVWATPMPDNGGFTVAAYIAAAVIYLCYAIYLVRGGRAKG
jgi:hypothetical protein